MNYVVKFGSRYLGKRTDGMIGFEDDAGEPFPRSRAILFPTRDAADLEAFRRDRYYGDKTDVEILPAE